MDGGLKHSTQFGLIDRGARAWGCYSAFNPDAFAQLVADARALAAESSPGPSVNLKMVEVPRICFWIALPMAAARSTWLAGRFDIEAAVE